MTFRLHFQQFRYTTCLCAHDEFLPRDASAERGNATVSHPSVCLSVCL